MQQEPFLAVLKELDEERAAGSESVRPLTGTSPPHSQNLISFFQALEWQKMCLNEEGSTAFKRNKSSPLPGSTFQTGSSELSLWIKRGGLYVMSLKSWPGLKVHTVSYKQKELNLIAKDVNTQANEALWE
ncbi:hypothetical protein GN956_G24725 [Arapaima gigas]